MENLSGNVYFIQAGDGPVKIGWAKGHPERRLRELQTAHHEPLSLLKVIPGSRYDESAWHGEFRAQHVHGEWFTLDDQLQAAMEAGVHPSREALRKREIAGRTQVIQIRVSPDEKAAIRNRAEEYGQTVSDYLRECGLAEDLDKPMPVPDEKDPMEQTKAFKQMVAQIMGKENISQAAAEAKVRES
jgi:hypothetical protein